MVTSSNRAWVLGVKAIAISVLTVSTLAASDFSMAGQVHTHGAAHLTLAYEGGALEVQLNAPAMSLLGFEQKPSTQQQINVLRQAKAFLAKSDNVFSIQGSDCVSKGTSISVSGPAGIAVDDNESSGTEHDLSDEQHSHSDHTINNITRESQHEGHSEISANYLLDCDERTTWESLTIHLFERFSGLEKIDVQWVTEMRQGETTLRAESSTIELR